MNDDTILFGSFVLDRRRRRLMAADREVRLRPKAWEVLLFLAERPGETVSLDVLLEQCWKDLNVSFQAATNAIYGLRAALVEAGGEADWIQNVSRRGYRFTAPVRIVAAAQEAVPDIDTTLPGLALVGRRKEISALEQCWRQTLRRRSQVVFVRGEPGIGKTRLVESFCAQLEQPHQICVGRCIPQQGEHEPYMPVLEALGSLASMKDVLTEARDEAPTWLIQMPWLLSREERGPFRRALAGYGPARMLREGKRLMALLAEQAPLVLVLEDVHWADHATTDLIRALATDRQNAPWLVIATYRPTELIVHSHALQHVITDLAGRASHVTTITLDGLSEQACREYLDRRFGDEEIGTQLAAVLEKKSGGNPLFLDTMTSFLCESGSIEHRRDGWRLTTPLDRLDIGLPDSLRDLVRAQLQQVGGENVRLLEAASVAGIDFSTLELEAALDKGAGEIEEECRSLARHGLIQRIDEMQWLDGSRGEAYRFAHVLYQQSILSDTLPSRRRALHARIGTRLVDAYGKRSREIAPRLVAHFEAAGDLVREYEYLKLSVQLAAGRYAHRETIAYIDRTIQVLESLPAGDEHALARLGWQTERSNLLMDWRGFAAAYDSFRQVVELADHAGNMLLQFIGHCGCAICGVFGSGHRDGARPAAEAVLAIARDGHPELLSIANIVAGCVCDTFGDPAGGLRHAEAALATVSDALPGLPRAYDIQTFAFTLSSGCLTRLGHLGRARRERSLAVEGAQTGGSLAGQAHTYAFAACDALIGGEPAEALSLAERAIHAGNEGGFDHFVYAGRAAREAATSMLASDEDIDGEALTRFADAIESRRRLGENWYNMLFVGYLADAHRRRGDLDHARTLIDGAFADAEIVYVAELWRIKGEIEVAAATCATPDARAAALAAAAACFESAIALAQEHETRLFELRAMTALTRLASGDDSARRRLLEVYSWFPSGLESSDLRAAELVMDGRG